MRNLRHGSLQMDITNKSPKLQSFSYDSKSGILVQKIKVKKTVLIHILFNSNSFLFCLLPNDREKYHLSFDICDPFWHSESDVARAEYLVSPIMP